MNKAQLLAELAQNTFVALKPSPIEGIGVFAIADIKEGQSGLFSKDKSEWIAVTKAEVEALPPHSRFLVENHCLYDDEHYFIPEYGFKMIDLVVYLNHSDEPNVRSINEGEDFVALRQIKAGEELLINYGEIVDE
ncbi:MAG: SET domain-containing protein [Ferruginibacter sp.]